MRSAIRPLYVLAASSALTSLPCWAATGSSDAMIDAFMSTDFSLVTTDVQFRFTELSAASPNDSSHILIDGLVPVEEGSAILTSNYRGIDITTGTEYDSGQVLLTLPSAPSGDGASSPIVGIVSRTGGWDGYTNTPASPTTVGESTGSFTFDNSAGTISFNLTQGSTNLTGSTTFSMLDDFTIDLAAFSLTDGTNTYNFGATQLVYGMGEYYGVIVSEDAGVDYDSLMFALHLASGDADGDGTPDLADPDEACPAPEGLLQNVEGYHEMLGTYWGWTDPGSGVLWSLPFTLVYVDCETYPWFWSYRQRSWFYYWGRPAASPNLMWIYSQEFSDWYYTRENWGGWMYNGLDNRIYFRMRNNDAPVTP